MKNQEKDAGRAGAEALWRAGSARRWNRAAAIAAAAFAASAAAAAAAEGLEDLGPPAFAGASYLPDGGYLVEDDETLEPGGFITAPTVQVTSGAAFTVADGAAVLASSSFLLDGKLRIEGAAAFVSDDAGAGIPVFNVQAGQIEIASQSTDSGNVASASLDIDKLHVQDRLAIDLRDLGEGVVATPTARISVNSIELASGAELWVNIGEHGAFLVGESASGCNFHSMADGMTNFGEGFIGELSTRSAFVAAAPIEITRGMHFAVGGSGFAGAGGSQPNLLIGAGGVLIVAEGAGSAGGAGGAEDDGFIELAGSLAAGAAPVVTFEEGTSVAFEKGGEIWLPDSFGDAEAAKNAERVVLSGINFSGATVSGEDNAVIRWNGYEGELAVGESGELEAILRPLEFGGDFSALLAHAWANRGELFLPKFFKRAFRVASGEETSRAVAAAAAAPYALGTHQRVREIAAGFGGEALRIAALAEADAKKAEAIKAERAREAAKAAQEEAKKQPLPEGLPKKDGEEEEESRRLWLWSEAAEAARRVKEEILYAPIYVSIESGEARAKHRSAEGLLSDAKRSEAGASIAAVAGWGDAKIGISAAYRSADVEQRQDTSRLAAEGKSDVFSAALWAVKPLAGGWTGAADLFYLSASDDAELSVLRTRFEARGIDRTAWGGGLALQTPSWRWGPVSGGFTGGLRYLRMEDADYKIEAEGEAAFDVKERGRSAAMATVGADLAVGTALEGAWAPLPAWASKHLPRRIDAKLHAGAAFFLGGRSIETDYAIADGFGGPGASVSHEGLSRTLFDASAGVELDFRTMRLGADLFAGMSGGGADWRRWGGRIRLDMLLDA